MIFRRNNNNNTSQKKKSVPPSTPTANAAPPTSSSSKTTTIIWPKSVHDFCIKGTPVTFQFSPTRTFQLDFGTLMLNFGAITSLTGFMMTDVLYLRSMSIVGSISGVIYNVSRTPPQKNAVAWGAVFIVVNTVQIIRLILERQEIKFTVEEAELFYKHFEPFGVEAKTFKELMHTLAHWKSYEAGQVIVADGKPLGKVLILVDGKATAHKIVPVEASLGMDDDNFDTPKDTKKKTPMGNTATKPLYSYSSGENGKIIGATGLIDPDLLGRNYPNRIVTDTKTRLLSFDTKKLCEFLISHDASMEAAIFHMMYVDLVGSLRRHRTLSGVGQGIGMAVHDLKIMLQQACADGIIHPAERRLIRQFMEKHSMDDSQLYALLESDDVGWTKEEWKDGAKLEVLKEQEQTEQELGKLMQHVLSDIK